MPRLYLVLWDIDKTLVDGAEVAHEVWRLAFERLTGSAVTQPFVPDGSTDPAIIADLADLHGLAPAEYPPDLLERAYIDAFEKIRDRWLTDARPMPGAAAALGDIAAWPGFVQTTLTGNVRGNAERKLATLGLAGHIDFEAGAYGSDRHQVRADLVRTAQQRAGAAYGGLFERANTILVGDTPRDVLAARDGGAQSIAVAAGGHDAAALAAAGADAVVENVAAVPAAVRALITDPA